MRKIQDQAADFGANGVIGIDLDYESLRSGKGGMPMVRARRRAARTGGE